MRGRLTGGKWQEVSVNRYAGEDDDEAGCDGLIMINAGL